MIIQRNSDKFSITNHTVVAQNNNYRLICHVPFCNDPVPYLVLEVRSEEFCWEFFNTEKPIKILSKLESIPTVKNRLGEFGAYCQVYDKAEIQQLVKQYNLQYAGKGFGGYCLELQEE